MVRPCGTSRAADVLVVGGGIVGVAVARACAREGLATTLIDRGPFGGGVTGASLACLGTHMQSLPELPLLIEACELWAEIAQTVPGDMEYDRRGQLRFVLEEADLPVAESWVEGERAAGLSPTLLDPTEVAAVEPRLTGPILGATWSPDDATVNPFLAVRALLADGRRHGLDARPGLATERLVREGDRIVGVDSAQGRLSAEHIVVAAGPWSARVLGTAGLEVPVVPRQAQCLASTRQPPSVRTVVGACEAAGGVEAGYTQIQQAMSGQVLFNTVSTNQVAAPGAEDGARQVSAGFAVDSIRTLVRLFPSLSDLRLLRSWARFEAVTPDGRFLAGPTGVEGLWVAAGDNGAGFCRAPLLGARIARAIATDEATPRLYDPARFEAAA